MCTWAVSELFLKAACESYYHFNKTLKKTEYIMLD